MSTKLCYAVGVMAKKYIALLDHRKLIIRSKRVEPGACSVVLSDDSTLECFHRCHVGIGMF